MRFRHSAATVGLLIALSSGQALARLDCKGPTMKAYNYPYSALIEITHQSVGTGSDEATRAGVLAAVVRKYRDHYGQSLLPPGSTFKMVYINGTRECGHVVSNGGDIEAMPIEGSQRGFAGPGEVEETSWYISLFNRNQPRNDWYTVCWDYFSNGVLTETDCEVHRF